jgi:3-oxoacyl-[acyl-carrier-protein] synthase-1
MVSAVGRDALTSCASLRAGISRARCLPSFTVLDADEQDAAPVTACAVHGFSEGFQGLGAWVRLACLALRDLLHSCKLQEQAFWDQAALLVAAPILDRQRFDGMEWTPQSILQDYGLAVARRCGLSLRADLAEIIPAGHAAAAAAIERAGQLVAEGIPRVLLMAADSYIDPMTLDWLAGLGRLKTPDNPAGLIPGEAAACVLLEPAASVSRRNGRAMAVARRAATAAESEDYLSGKRSQGRALASAVDKSLGDTGGPFTGDVIADLNGEEWRAYELGCVRVRLRSRLESAHLVYPAVSFGESGAASGVLGLCVATRSLEREYAHGDSALVTSSSDDGRVGAIYVTR